MKKLIMLTVVLTTLFTGFVTEASSLGATYKWSLPAIGRLNLYTNYSGRAIGFMYSVNNGSDSVVVRCPLNDTPVRANQTYICSLLPNETAWIELRQFGRGASGTYAVLG